MPLDKLSIEEKISKLKEISSILEGYKIIPRDKFSSDYTITGAAERYLILGVEIVTDIGNHILSEVFQVSAKEYGEIIMKLGELKVVDKNFAEKNTDMAKFRNLLVHEYIKIDLDKVYDNLQKTPDVFRQFAKYYVDFLDKTIQ